MGVAGRWLRVGRLLALGQPDIVSTLRPSVCPAAAVAMADRMERKAWRPNSHARVSSLRDARRDVHLK